MISVKETEAIHSILIEQFGGSNGIRDLSGLESALARPFQTFAGTDLYPTPIHKAAALIESLLINHPFIDGNKRTGYVMMRMLLIKNGLDIHASQDEKYIFVVNIASGLTTTEEIIDWLTAHVK
ncbi:MAG: death on curing protein [Ferruginibacter sp.]|uniref:type II toxin-antitoxin system death-on-curing family toxin n=1 Tax=Ferruginibacter sp. TaxID=1940288 RepID=UPI00265993F9|nr:type II toxin-antitoxin system death-on-curing family toxin [Ferruginibacter sp.]MDB5279695.1 death on curing protein [Ferruginibacter sp.]